MKDGPGRLLLAAAALVGVWVAVYWLWPSAPPPPITFDDPSDAHLPAAPALTKTSEAPAPASAAPEHKPEPATNRIGASLEPAPAPEFAPVVPPEFDTHVVAEGETIWSIAKARWGDANLGGVIARANPLVDPKKLKPGDRLLIPKDPRNVQGVPLGPTPAPAPEIIRYVVSAGDTLGEIAERFYGKSSLWTRIRDANPGVVSQSGGVRVGATLLIPPPPQPKGAG